MAVAAALGLAACGGPESNGLEDATAAEVRERAVAAFRDASSVRVVGGVASSGRDDGSRYDLVLSGTSSMGTIERGGTEHEIIKIGEDTYVRADRAYYEALGETDAAPLLADQWVRLTGSEAAKQYQSYTQEGLALAVERYTEGLAGPVTKTEIGDEPAVSASSPNRTTLWAASTGDPVPLRLEISGTDTGALEFSGYNEEVSISPPADALDFARLG